MTKPRANWTCNHCGVSGDTYARTYCTPKCAGAARRAARPDVTGMRFGSLQVLSIPDLAGDYIAICKCDCGNDHSVSAIELRRGRSRSCGCLARDAIRARSTTHGMWGSTTNKSWSAMKERCQRASSKDYEEYGGRGIQVCERWREFANFLADMGERPPGTTLDRIDVNGNYEPGNCRWAVSTVQQGNRRNCINVRLSDGQVTHVAEAARRLGVTRPVLERMVKKGEVERV